MTRLSLSSSWFVLCPLERKKGKWKATVCCLARDMTPVDQSERQSLFICRRMRARRKVKRIQTYDVEEKNTASRLITTTTTRMNPHGELIGVSVVSSMADAYRRRQQTATRPPCGSGLGCLLASPWHPSGGRVHVTPTSFPLHPLKKITIFFSSSSSSFLFFLPSVFFFYREEEAGAAVRRVLVGHAGIHASKCFFALPLLLLFLLLISPAAAQPVFWISSTAFFPRNGWCSARINHHHHRHFG